MLKGICQCCRGSHAESKWKNFLFAMTFFHMLLFADDFKIDMPQTATVIKESQDSMGPS